MPASVLVIVLPRQHPHICGEQACLADLHVLLFEREQVLNNSIFHSLLVQGLLDLFQAFPRWIS